MSKKDANSKAEEMIHDIESKEDIPEVPESVEADSEGESNKTEEDLTKAKNDYLYLRADFDNYKKQVIKERSELIKFGTKPLLVEVLNVLDIFEKALGEDVTPENLENFKKGFELTATELTNVVKKFGIIEVPSEGLAFDPNIHEALGSEETSNVPAGHITQVFRKGFKLHDRMIRPAQVVVAKEPAPSEE